MTFFGIFTLNDGVFYNGADIDFRFSGDLGASQKHKIRFYLLAWNPNLVCDKRDIKLPLSGEIFNKETCSTINYKKTYIKKQTWKLYLH